MTTVVILAHAHCGTSMLAGICQIFGVQMVGTRYHRFKLEDYEVSEALSAGQFADLVARRDAEHSSWGFKLPGAWRYADQFTVLRDPVYLAIWKDPVSVARRRYGRSTDRWMRKVRNTCMRMFEEIDGIQQAGLPAHTLAYQQALVDPAGFVQDVAERIRVQPTEEQLERAAQHIQPVTWFRQSYPRIEL